MDFTLRILKWGDYPSGTNIVEGYFKGVGRQIKEGKSGRTMKPEIEEMPF
jgi:hypothetical protein